MIKYYIKLYILYKAIFWSFLFIINFLNYLQLNLLYFLFISHSRGWCVDITLFKTLWLVILTLWSLTIFFHLVDFFYFSFVFNRDLRWFSFLNFGWVKFPDHFTYSFFGFYNHIFVFDHGPICVLSISIRSCSVKSWIHVSGNNLISNFIIMILISVLRNLFCKSYFIRNPSWQL